MSVRRYTVLLSPGAKRAIERDLLREEPPPVTTGMSGAVVFGSGTAATKAAAKDAALAEAKSQCGGDAFPRRGRTPAWTSADGRWSAR